ncbi:MAG: trypsin-like peptidase domain-containing protein [Planctomycetia bacterium]
MKTIGSLPFVSRSRRAPGRSPRLACWLCGLTAVALAAALGAATPAARADEPAGTAEAMAHATALSKAFRHAAQVATPTVVVVRSETKARKPASGRRQPGRGQNQQNPFKGTPLEEMFPDGLPEGFEFNIPEGGRGPKSGVGSGVIVDPSGIVLTNNHVVEGADVVTVELSDGREFTASDIKTDPESDLAVVRLAGARDLPTARLGDSDKLSIGDWVIAIGTPFELETTVSAGIISGKGRELGGIRRAQFLQTDAAINPGNSGGPLVNLAGEVVGINTAIASNSGGYQGIGFAIPVNLAKWVSGQLIARGAVERAYMGVQMGPLDARMAAKLGVKDHRKGVLVNDVVPGSPAAEAGVQDLDVITAFDDQPIEGTRSLQEIVERATIGKPHKLTVLRDGKVVTLSVAVKPLPTDLAARDGGRRPAGRPDSDGETFYSKDFGLEVRAKDSVAEDAYEGFSGVLVDRVDEDGVAAAAGLGPGMLIRGVGRSDVKSVAEFAAALEKESAADGVWLKVRTPRGNVPLLLQRM